MVADRAEQLIQTHYGRVLRLLTRLTGSITQAEDLAQTVFLGLLRTAPEIEHPDEARIYVTKSAFNAWRQWSKKATPATLPADVEALLLSDEPEVLDVLAEKDDIVKILSMIHSLPDQQRAVFVLTVFEGMGYNQVAEIMGVPRSTVSMWRVRAVRYIRETMRYAEPVLREP